MRIIGIDPGVHGAVALFERQLDSVRLVSVDDTPTFEVSVLKKTAKGGRARRNEYDVAAMINLLLARGQVDLAVIENLHPMPKNGGIGNFRSGYGFGLWVMACSAFGIPLERVAPQTWKAAMLKGLPKGKKASLIRARELYPQAPLELEGHDGRADALMLATYGLRHLIGAPRAEVA